MKDERIEQAINKIRSEMALILYFGVIISFIIKSLILNMDTRQYLTEFIIIIFIPIYQFIRMNMLKVSIVNQFNKKDGKLNLILTAAIIVITSALILLKMFQQSIALDWKVVTNVSIFLILFIAGFYFNNQFNKVRSRNYEKKYDDDK